MDKKIIIRQSDILKDNPLKDYPDNYFHGFLADAPYDLPGGFMGKDWDKSGIAFNVNTWKEVYRVLKPGAFFLCYGGTRTYHRMVCAIEDAGFEIRDCLMWLYGQGFPKSMDISKALDKMAGAEREVIGKYVSPGEKSEYTEGRNTGGNHFGNGEEKERFGGLLTVPFTDKAKLWEGYGTALKPSWEPIVLAMKPIDGTFAQNALKWGTGGLNIDESRIGSESINTHNRGNNMAFPKRPNEKTVEESGRNVPQNNISSDFHKGRFPANLLLTHHSDCTSENCHFDCPIGQLNESVGVKKSGDNCIRTKQGDGYHGNMGKAGDVQTAYGDSGFVSRFFYNGKVSRKERELGLDAISMKPKTEEYAGRDTKCSVCHKFFLSSNRCTCDEKEFGPKAERMENPESHNNHPTLKPIALNQYLANLIRPPYGEEPLRLLNCFSGVCSEAIGAFFAGWQEIVCIEREKDYTNIGQARVEYWTKFASYDTGMNVGSIPVRKKKGEMPTLF